MNETSETFRRLRDRQLSWGLRGLATFGLLVLVISLSRAFTTGWQPVMPFQILMYLLVVCTALLGRRLSFSVRATIVITIGFILAVTGLLTYGLVGMGLPSLFACCILATMLFGSRTGCVSIGISALILAVVGFLFVRGILTLAFNPLAYIRSYSSWLAALCGMAFVGGLIVLVLGTLNQEIENLVEALRRRNVELSDMVRQLKGEMAERARVEDERRALDEKLQQAKRMEDLGTLAGGVAHDLNNILVGTVSYPDLLLSRLPVDSPLREPLETIRRSGVKAAAIVQDLLTLARRGVTSFQALNLNTVIVDYFSSPEYERLKSFHPRVEAELRLDPGLPNLVGSHVHLLKVVMNLVSNAAEAMPDGGRLVVSTSAGKTGTPAGSIESIEAGEYVILQVSDTGIGIPKEDVSRILEPFFTKKKMGHSGTGLGMAVVWGTVKDHKGHIDVESVVGKGTTFSIYFPATVEKAAAIRGMEPLSQGTAKGESILIVDDVREQREIAAKMLAELGYSVEAVSSGEEAIAFVNQRQVDLLILDMYMEPGMDGLDTYREIRKLRPEQKAIITSGYAQTERVKETQELGAGSFVRKPFFMDTIAVAVRAELDRVMNRP
ncbi:MAG: ATP-binding protein [Syntrophorhabdales bacterium]|jgi:signal transduction histidine kinase/CheY-like chemotaxis protein